MSYVCVVSDISVPCPGCSEPLRFGDRACPSCRRAVPRASRAALDARLEAASGDFRDLKDHIRSASVTLVILALLYVGVGILAYLVESSSEPALPTPQELLEARVSLATNLAVGAGLGACFFWARRRPASALTTALMVWLLAQVPALLVSRAPVLLFMATHPRPAVASLLALALLVRGVFSALRAERLRSALRRSSEPPRERTRPPYR